MSLAVMETLNQAPAVLGLVIEPNSKLLSRAGWTVNTADVPNLPLIVLTVIVFDAAVFVTVTLNNGKNPDGITAAEGKIVPVWSTKFTVGDDPVTLLLYASWASMVMGNEVPAICEAPVPVMEKWSSGPG